MAPRKRLKYRRFHFPPLPPKSEFVAQITIRLIFYKINCSVFGKVYPGSVRILGLCHAFIIEVFEEFAGEVGSVGSEIQSGFGQHFFGDMA